jgi:hypothetical protein
MRKPLSSFFNIGNSQPAKPTFGQKRAEQISERMDKAIGERRKLARAEYAAEDPLKTTYGQKSDLVERKIDRITAELSEAKK